ncbi:hypothetical protein O3M35_008173 [Rhynocoris fuscipes]
MVHLKEDNDLEDVFQSSADDDDITRTSENEDANESIADTDSTSTWTGSKSSVAIIYPCYLCNFETCRSTSLVAHLRQHRQGGLILEAERFQIGKFVCSLCNFKTRWLSSLKEHEQNVHFSNVNSTNFVLSNINASNNINSNRMKDSPFICRQCGYSAEKLETITAHMKRHFTCINVFGNIMRNYPCCLCDFTTRQFVELQNHITSVHNDNRIVYGTLTVQPSTNTCSRFERLFSTFDDKISNLVKNEDDYTPEYPCDYCSHRATSIYLWRDHMESHGGVLEISVTSVHN